MFERTKNERLHGDRAGVARLVTALMVFAMLAGGLGAWSPVEAQGDAPVWGYVWGNDATAASYTPDAVYQFNSAGAQATIERGLVGEYIVHIAAPFTPYTVQVTAYGAPGNSCFGNNYGGDGAETRLWVRCWTAAGEGVDSQFSLYYASNGVTAPTAYLFAELADNAVGEAYGTSDNSSWNAAGGANTVTRLDVGRYEVALPGLGANALGNVQVTPYTFVEAAARVGCSVLAWNSSNAAPADLWVEVNCVDANGAPADVQFFLAYYTSSSVAATAGANYWTDVSVNGSERYIGDGLQVTATGTGVYRITIPSPDSDHFGTALATTVTSNDPVWCSVSDVGLDQGNAVVGVRCVDVNGQPVDADYSMTWARSQ